LQVLQQGLAPVSGQEVVGLELWLLVGGAAGGEHQLLVLRAQWFGETVELVNDVLDLLAIVEPRLL